MHAAPLHPMPWAHPCERAMHSIISVLSLQALCPKSIYIRVVHSINSETAADDIQRVKVRPVTALAGISYILVCQRLREPISGHLKTVVTIF
jgi:hypothetical protein